MTFQGLCDTSMRAAWTCISRSSTHARLVNTGS
jgi:hypothetical protein